MYSTLRPLLFHLDTETAHRISLYALGVAQRSRLMRLVAPRPMAWPLTAFGIRFANPVGLAAGLDKNGEHLDALDALGFGHVEIGTVTPRAQPGNPRPRLFRLPRHEAIINRMGFNNAGVDALLRNIDRAEFSGVLGINIGKNKDTPLERAADDYLFCLKRVHARANYITVNISSPNTPQLRELQHRERLRQLVGSLREAQESLGSQAGARRPLLLKIAPDLDEGHLDDVAGVVAEHAVDGLILTNTTLDHGAVSDSPHGGEAGGLSGWPLFERSTAVLRGMRQRVGPKVALIGVGGILEGDHAAQKIDAGANLVQLYTGLVYRGPELIAECVEEIARQQPETRPGHV